jgi:hypothetical protein
MAEADTLNFQNLSTVQSKLQPGPKTLASANTIAPSGFLTVLTGNTVVKTITPPQTGLHMLAIQFAGVAGVDATGNVLTAKASVNGEIMLLVYNPNTAKYIPVG